MFRRQWIIGALVLAAFSASPAFAVEKSQDKATTDKIAKHKSELTARADKALQKLFKEEPDSKKLYEVSDKGLMASADISGTKFWANDDLNKKPAAAQKTASTQKSTTLAQKSTTSTQKK